MGVAVDEAAKAVTVDLAGDATVAVTAAAESVSVSVE